MDAYVESSAVNTNYGAAQKLWLGKGSSDVGEIYLWFDLSSIPAGSIINGATLRLYQYDDANDWLSVTITVRAMICNTSWAEGSITWANRSGGWAPSAVTDVSFANVISTNLAFDMTAQVRQICYGSASNTGFVVYYTGSSSSTRKYFRSREYATDSSKWPLLEIDYTAPTAPSQPTGGGISPNPCISTIRCSWSGAGAGYNNPITNYYLRWYANGASQWEGYVGNTSYYDINISSYGEGTLFSFDVWAIGTYNPAWSGNLHIGDVIKDRKPYTPSNVSVPKTSYIPGDTIRVSFTNPGDPDGNLAGFEVGMQDALGNWYGGSSNPTIVCSNASAAATYVDVNTTGWAQGLQWKFFVRGYDAQGLRSAWSASPSQLVTMNTAPLQPTINFPINSGTVFNPSPRVLLTAGAWNDGVKHTVLTKMNGAAQEATGSTPSRYSCGTNDTLAGNQKVVYSPAASLGQGAGKTITAWMNDGFLDSPVASSALTVAALAFTDPDLSLPHMKIKAVHLTELQTAINTLRVAYGIAPRAFTAIVPNITLVSNTAVIAELQNAVQDIINLINGWDSSNATFDIAITWQTITAPLGGVDPIKLRQAIEQLRSVLVAI